MTRTEGVVGHDVIVIGAGFAGLYLTRTLRDELRLSVIAFETGDDVGGTWYWNRYPGARCDVESVFYSFTFDDDLRQEWTWTERYAAQPEILKYAKHVADRFDLRPSIRFSTTVESAHYDEVADRWVVRTDDGATTTAQFLITAVGCLSAPVTPHFNGIERFDGDIYHTGRWPQGGVDFTGQRVVVIGTGSSGIQAIPEIAKQASTVTVLQRTASFTVPANNRPLTGEESARTKRQYAELVAAARNSSNGFLQEQPLGESGSLDPGTLRVELERRWWSNALALQNMLTDAFESVEANDLIADFVRDKVREAVADPDVAEILVPRDYPIGTKRLILDTGFYDTFNQSHVSVVDVRNSPIEEVTATGVTLSDRVIDADAIVLATGYDAMTGALRRIDIRGTSGRTLAGEWEDGPHTYLGLAVRHFPNMLTVTGPGSPSVFTNMIASIEQHVEWIRDLLVYCREHDIGRVEATQQAQDEWTSYVSSQVDGTLFPEAASWYMGANIPGKPRVFMPFSAGLHVYRRECAAIAEDSYRGFELGRTSAVGRYDVA